VETDVALHVASPIGVQRATDPRVGATGDATVYATDGRKPAPLPQSACNDACNADATGPQLACNGGYESAPHSLHVIGGTVYRLTAKEVREESSYNRVCCLLCRHLTRTGVCRSKSTQATNYHPLEYGGRWRRCEHFCDSS